MMWQNDFDWVCSQFNYLIAKSYSASPICYLDSVAVESDFKVSLILVVLFYHPNNKPEREPYWPSGKLRVSITGARGFFASYITKRLKSEGCYIITSDWKKNKHMTEDIFYHEFHLFYLRVMQNYLKVTSWVYHVFNLATDMVGIGFIQSSHSVIMYSNMMIGFNMLEAARMNGVKRFVTMNILCIYKYL